MATMEGYLRRTEQVRRVIMDRLLSGEGAGGVAAALHQLTGRPVSILNQCDGGLTSAPADFRPPQDLDENLLAHLPARNHPVQVGGRLLGHLIFWGGAPVDRLLLEHGATAAALAIRQQGELLEISRRFADELLAALIGDGPGLGVSLYARAAKLGVVLCDDYVVACLTGEAKPGSAPLHQCGRWLPPGSLCGLDRQERLVILLPGDLPDEEAGDPESGAKRLLADLLQRLQSQAGTTWRAALGRFHPGHDGVRLGYREAVTALRLGQGLGDASRNVIFRELGIYRLLHQDPFAAADFVTETVGPVLAHDQERQTRLASTLEAFLTAGGNFREAAKRLYVHHNTVRHRIAQVARLTGLDLNDPDQRLNLQVALKLFPVVNS